MKRIFSNVMLLAAAATAFFSCQKPEVIVPETSQEVTLTFSSEKPAFDDETKTEWNGETIQWSEGDKIAIAYTCNEKWMGQKDEKTQELSAPKLYKSDPLAIETETAKFNVSASFNIQNEGTHVFYGVYPAPSSTSFADAPSASLTVPALQTPKANSFDGAADLMTGVSVDAFNSLADAKAENISMKWTRLVAHANITLKDLNDVTEGETVSSIKLTAQEGANLVGSQKVNIITNEVTNNNNESNILELNGGNLTIDKDGNIEFWACILPETLTSLTVVVETNKATYTREITGIEKTFMRNARNILAINMASADREAIEAATLPFEMNFSGTTGTTILTKLEGFKTLDYVYRASGAIRLASGDNDGLLETKMLDLSNDFHVLVTAAGWDSDELAMTVSAGNESHGVTLKTYNGVFAEYLINFSPVNSSSSVKFAAAKGKRCYIEDIKILSGHATLSPEIIVSVPKQVAAAGGSASFTYTLMNPQDGNEVSASTDDEDWITDIKVDDVNSIISYTVAENTSETPREGVIELYYGGKPYNEVPISQEAKLPDGEGKAIYTITSTSTVTTGGSAPIGSIAAYSSTHTSKYQLTAGKSMTLTLTGYDGCTITGITLSMKSNTSSGAGTLSIKSGEKEMSLLDPGNFETWYGKWSTEYVDFAPSVTPTVVGTDESVVITLAATANSLYCQSITICYEEPVN